MHRSLTFLLLAAGLLSWTGCGSIDMEEPLPNLMRSSSALTGTCGDGNRTADEQCDDGDTEDGDGCSSSCTVENGYLCTDANFSLAYAEQWSGSTPPVWTLSPDGLTVRQSTNSNPAVYMTNLPAAGVPLVFDLAVETTNDDDFIGWVVGFDPGDSTSPQADFMLFDWKQANQDDGRRGLALSRVTGSANTTHLWDHIGPVSEMARGFTRGELGWADNTAYRVQMEYTTSRIRVWINGVLEFDQQGSFPAGRFGFYTYSQPNGRFTLVSPTTGSICGLDPDADPDGDGVPTGDDPEPFDPSICGDANGDGIDDCAPQTSCIEVRLGDYNLFVLEDYSLGTDVEGKVAAGGDISMNHFSVGHRVPNSQIAHTLVAGGDLNLSNGGVWGDAWYGGSYAANSTVTFVRGAPAQGNPIDFAARGVELRTLSSQLAALDVNGTTTLESWGGVMLHGSSPDVNVFEVPASAFSSAKLLSIHAPAGSLALINIHGDSASFSGFGHSFSGGIDQHGVLFNFIDATSISAQGFGFWGTVLAPYAHVSFINGSFDGGLYARSMTGNAEGHLNPLYDRDICP